MCAWFAHVVSVVLVACLPAVLLACDCRPAAARTLTAACCGLAFSRPDLLALHQTARPRPLACPSCPEVLPSEPALTRHQETHLACLLGGRLLCSSFGGRHCMIYLVSLDCLSPAGRSAR